MSIKFGTDGWRAIIGQDYTYENVGKVLQAFCDVYRLSRGQWVVVGYDRRFCSSLFAETAVQVLLGNGFKVFFSKQFCPTPCISWMTQQKKAVAGVMITASHNPYQWNGIKFKENYGGSASLALTEKIEEKIRKNKQGLQKIKKMSLEEGIKKSYLKFFDPHREYLQSMFRLIDIKKIQRAKLRIVVDPMHGAASSFFSSLLHEVIEIRGEENPSFGGVNPEPIEKNLKSAVERVLQLNADIGLATDGDADRIGAIDEKGGFIDSHHIFALLLRHLVVHKGWRGDVIKTVSTTRMIDVLAKRYGLNVIETPIGFKYICQEFCKTDPLIGGEESGGIGIAKHVYERDGILSGLLLLEILALYRKPFSKILEELREECGAFFFRREDLVLSVERIQKIQRLLHDGEQPNFGRLRVKKKSFTDGFKFEFEDESWLLIRPSGTEPLLRVYAEARSVARVKKLLKTAIKFTDSA